jgi:ADP-ribose pyrophosphatase YjhB (NUDIX family)
MGIGEMGENKHEGFNISPRPPLECTPASEDAQKRVPARRLLSRLLHRWSRLTRGMTLGVKALVINEAGEVLLIRHTYVPGWHLPGGGVEVGETAEQALARELAEETAVELNAPPRLHGLLLNLNLARRDHVAVYVIERFVQGRPTVPNREIAELGFFAVDALPAGTTAPTQRRIEEVLHGRPAAAHW